MTAKTDASQENGYRVLALMLWRERWIFLAVFLLITVAGLLAVLQLDRSYTARSGLLVRYNDAYVYTPLLGDSNIGESFNLDQIIQTEIGLFRADAVKTRALEDIGLERIYPEIAEDYAGASPEERPAVYDSALRTIRDELGAGASANTSIIEVSFTHDDPQIAADFLNILISKYLTYRREVLLGSRSDDFAGRRDDYEQRLADANEELEQFLTEIGVGDFPSAREALRARHARIADDLLQARADLATARAELKSIDDDLARLPVEVEQYVENDASGRLLELQMERQELLTRYRPDATPVQEVGEQIEGIQQFLSQGGAEGAGMRRVGPNPVRQALQTDSLTAEARVSSLQERVQELEQQLRQTEQQQLRMQSLAPRYEQLARTVRALESTLDQIVTRNEERRAQRELVAEAADNVRIVEPAQAPTQGHSLKMIGLLAVLVVAGFLALAAALLRAFIRKPQKPLPAPAASQPLTTSTPAPAPIQPMATAAVSAPRRAVPRRPARRLPILAVVGRDSA